MHPHVIIDIGFELRYDNKLNYSSHLWSRGYGIHGFQTKCKLFLIADHSSGLPQSKAGGAVVVAEVISQEVVYTLNGLPVYNGATLNQMRQSTMDAPAHQIA